MFKVVSLTLLITLLQGCSTFLDKMAEVNNRDTYVYRGSIIAITNAKSEIHIFPPSPFLTIALSVSLADTSLLNREIINMLIRDAKTEEIVESYVVGLTDGTKMTVPRRSRPYVAGECVEFITFNEMNLDFSKQARLELVKIDCANILKKQVK